MPTSSTSANFVAAVLASALMGGCATMPSSGKGARGFLRFEVEPANAEVEIDEKYSGAVNGWVGGVVPVQPGLRRVTLRAPGFIPQRFDLEVGVYEEVTLVLALEPVLELPPDEAPEEASITREPVPRVPFREKR